MTKLIIIAGPQSSGKTTLFKYLQKKHPNWQFVSDTDPRTVTGKKHFGAVNVSAELEEKILEQDLKNIKNIDRKKEIVIAECGIFNCVYAQHFLYEKLANHYYKEYLKIYEGLNPYVFFIKTIPEISWQRRKEKYRKRILDRGVTDQKIIEEYLYEYKKIIETLYPSWLEFYKKIPFKKIMIENSYKEKGQFLKEADKIIQSLLTR